MKKWNFGIVGTGLIANIHAAAIKKLPNGCLSAACDIRLDRAEDFCHMHGCKAYVNYDQMFKDPNIDIICIATPSGLHMEPVVSAAQSGKHVICEKPVEILLDKIDAMIDAHQKAGTKLGCIFQNRFMPAVLQLKKAIDEGRFGIITYVGVFIPWWRSNEYYKNTWRGTWMLDGGGALMNQSIHMIDLLCYLLPPVVSVQAFAGTLAHPEIETEDTAVAIMRFKNNALGVVHASTASYPGNLKRLEISGSKGSVILVEDSFTFWQFEEEKETDREMLSKYKIATSTGGASDPGAINTIFHEANLKAFINSLENKATFELDATQGRKAVELVLAIYRSAKDQKIVNL